MTTQGFVSRGRGEESRQTQVSDVVLTHHSPICSLVTELTPRICQLEIIRPHSPLTPGVGDLLIPAQTRVWVCKMLIVYN